MEGNLSGFSFLKPKKPTAVIILDGWGIAPVWGGNAIAIADVPNFNMAFKKHPSTTLMAADGAVGLPPGAPGNSEAGHLNIGAGNLIKQDQVVIDEYINDGSFFTNKELLAAVDHARKNNSKIHLLGLLSKTGTHSQIAHLYALLKLLKDQNFYNVFIHLFGDGRDSDSMSGIEMVAELQGVINSLKIGQICSIVGRSYAMDRDHNWDRIQRTYDMLVYGKGNAYDSTGAIFAHSYSRGVTDEFIEPSIVVNKTSQMATVADNDSVIYFNFRADRASELISAFLDPNLPSMHHRTLFKNLYFVSFVMYHENSLAKSAFAPPMLQTSLSKIWSDKGHRQFHTAESEKYAHVTYFFDGGNSKPNHGEDWHVVPSKKGRGTYDKIPEMSAYELTENIVSVMKKNTYDDFIINFANADMVGHTGDFKAAVQAVEHVDICLGRVLTEILNRHGLAIIIADHGNAEQMVNPKTGDPDTEHTVNPVPFIAVSENFSVNNIAFKNDGILASVAPTVLELTDEPKTTSQLHPSLLIK